MSKHHILILGGGFGGLYTALELEKALKNDSDTEITLINRDNYFLFTPMLHEVAASDLDLTNIVSPVRKLGSMGIHMSSRTTSWSSGLAQAPISLICPGWSSMHSP